MLVEKEIYESVEISKFKKYTKKILRIVLCSLIGIVGGLGMIVLYMFWSMHFIPELAYYDTTTSFPIFTTIIQMLFILGAEFIAGFLSTNIEKAMITNIIVSSTFGIVFILIDLIQAIAIVITTFIGIYLGGYFAEH